VGRATKRGRSEGRPRCNRSRRRGLAHFSAALTVVLRGRAKAENCACPLAAPRPRLGVTCMAGWVANGRTLLAVWRCDAIRVLISVLFRLYSLPDLWPPTRETTALDRGDTCRVPSHIRVRRARGTNTVKNQPIRGIVRDL